MQSLEQTAKRWNHGAVVAIEQAGLSFERAAAFVFETEKGELLWVEPGYLDRYGATSPAIHQSTEAAQPVSKAGEEATSFTAAAGTWTATVSPVTEEDAAELFNGALERFTQSLSSAGTTWEQERERVRALVLDN
jgi:hypothetical protein